MGKKRKKRDAEGQMTFDLCGNLSAEGGEVKGRDTLGQGSQTPVKRKHEPVRREDLRITRWEKPRGAIRGTPRGVRGGVATPPTRLPK